MPELDRKSTRLNSSHKGTSYAVFCLKKKIILLSEVATMKKILMICAEKLAKTWR